MKKISVLAAIAALPLLAAPASAAVVCNDEGDCWRVKNKYDYKPEWKLRVYADDWKWADKDKDRYRWREAGPKRGYWSKGVWIEF